MILTNGNIYGNITHVIKIVLNLTNILLGVVMFFVNDEPLKGQWKYASRGAGLSKLGKSEKFYSLEEIGTAISISKKEHVTFLEALSFKIGGCDVTA